MKRKVVQFFNNRFQCSHRARRQAGTTVSAGFDNEISMLLES